MRLPYSALFALLIASVSARAQTSFTELALSDPDLGADPDTDLWLSSTAPGDVDGDGDLDILVAAYFVDHNTGEAEERLTLYRNDGPSGTAGWTLTAVSVDTDGLTFANADLAWADVDNDGDLDVVVGADDRTVLYRNDGGILTPTTTALPGYAEYNSDFSTLDQTSLAWADVDNDGDPDLLIPAVQSPSGLGYEPTALLRNDGPVAGGAWTFTQIAALAPAWNAVSRWGDTDGDGDLDLLHGNVATIGDADGSFLTVYRNDGGTLVLSTTGLAHLMYGMIDWGDADGDGDLDILVAGLTPANEDGEGGGDAVQILYKTPGGYTPVTLLDDEPGSDWLNFNAASWADYDSDGDVDLLVAGEAFTDDGIGGQAQVYVNNGTGTFTAGTVLPAPSSAAFEDGAFVWFDVDGDGDLDYFTSGPYGDSFGWKVGSESRLFRNDATENNAPPSAPVALVATPSATGAALSWAPATDDGTPTRALTYNIRVMTLDGSDIVSPMSRPAGGRMLPEAGNVSLSTAWALSGLEPGTYRWTVQAVDNAFNGGPFATEGTFTVGSVVVEPGVDAVALAVGVAPNPVAGAGAVTVALTASSTIRVAVLDALGREVTVLHNGALTAGSHVLRLDTASLPPGVYVVRASSNGRTASRRLVVAR